MIWIPILFLIILGITHPILIYKITNLHQTLHTKAAENAALHMMVGDNNPREIMTKEEWKHELKLLEANENLAEKEKKLHEERQARFRARATNYPYFNRFLETYREKKLEPVLQRSF